ncbi:MAG: DUF3179 domain-containing protein [Planctomycetaceae bacterium]|nr:DUF3179 domain-containing protein [Planctomycetaceae bacterium]
MARYKKHSLQALCLCMVATGIAWGYLVYQDLNSSRNRYANLPDDPTGGTQMSTPGSMERIDRTFDAVSDSELQDDEIIIALEVNGVHYAYPKRRLSDIGAHVATEILGDLPVAVTYCNETECVRVFTGDAGGDRLDVTQEGLDEGKFVIRVNGKHFFQESEAIPLQDYAFELVRWSQWKTEHPDGLVLADYAWE